MTTAIGKMDAQGVLLAMEPYSDDRWLKIKVDGLTDRNEGRAKDWHEHVVLRSQWEALPTFLGQRVVDKYPRCATCDLPLFTVWIRLETTETRLDDGTTIAKITTYHFDEATCRDAMAWDLRARVDLLEEENAALRLRAGVTPARDKVTPRLRDYVFARDGHRCAYCGNGAPLQLDHIIPVSKGGSSDPGNLQSLCVPCNRAKGASLPPGLPNGQRTR
jgi:5-methylcytosine-specific restriction endonuclease McrA